MRENLIELIIEGNIRAFGKSESFAEVIADHLIANGVTFATDNNAGSRWIPVTERLPDIPDGWAEHPDPVLYMMKSTEMIYAGYYGENGIYRDKYFRQYHDRHEGVDADDVLCWMWQHDLPEAPKEVE
jgi:hypothetical protein